MRVITAPNEYTRKDSDICCFLAGGISNCHDWQTEVIKILESMELGGVNIENLVIFNPRRKNFPGNDYKVAEQQIEWEYKLLEQADIFSIYFSSGSEQPICMYELGRNVLYQMQHGNNWADRIIISVEDGYKRKLDVNVQIKLATGSKEFVTNSATPTIHAARIISKYNILMRGKK